MNKFTIASVAVATALLAGCGGSSSSDGGKGDELPSGGEAQACFNPELWEDATHEAKWQTKWNEDDSNFYTRNERYTIKNGVDFDHHKHITEVLTETLQSEVELSAEYFESKRRSGKKDAFSNWKEFQYFIVDGQSPAVSHADGVKFTMMKMTYMSTL